MYNGILIAVKCYQRRLGLDVKDNFVTGDAFVWRFLYKSNVKDIYSCLVNASETLKCTEKNGAKSLLLKLIAVFDNSLRCGSLR